MAIVSAAVTVSQRAELQRLAAEADRTLSAELRRAIASHLDRAIPPTTATDERRPFDPGAAATEPEGAA